MEINWCLKQLPLRFNIIADATSVLFAVDSALVKYISYPLNGMET